MSLKAELLKAIQSRNGEMLRYEEFEILCRRFGRKISNGERRLRECSDKIEAVKNTKKYIIGYRWKIKERQLAMF